MIPRGIRNNNPGNIIQSGIDWQGKLAHPDDPRFEQFDTPQNGIRALAKLLIAYQDKHGLTTVRGIINRWAPVTDNNNTEAYIAAVCAAIGVGADDHIDVHRFTTLAPLTTAIIQHENGQQPYPATMIAGAVNAALGTAPQERAPPPLTQRKDAPMGAIALPLLSTILPSILQLFSGRAQAAIGKVTGADPAMAEQFMQNLMGKVSEVSGVPVTDNASAIQAVAAITSTRDPVAIKALEDHSLDYIDKLAPLLDKMAAQEQARWKASDDSSDRAAVRGQRDKVDIAKPLAMYGVAIFGACLLLVGGALLTQVFRAPDKPVDALLASLLTILVYAASRIAESAYRYRFGGQAESSVVETGNTIVRDAVQTRKVQT